MTAQSLGLGPKTVFPWQRSKRQMIPVLSPLVPEVFNQYWEPFAGACSMYGSLWDAKRITSSSFLIDNNWELITAYKAMRDDPVKLCRALLEHTMNHERLQRVYYEQITRQIPATLEPLDVASRFIYLLRASKGGRYTTNPNGTYVGDWGLGTRAGGSQPVFDFRILNAWSHRLQATELICGDFHGG